MVNMKASVSQATKKGTDVKQNALDCTYSKPQEI